MAQPSRSDAARRPWGDVESAGCSAFGSAAEGSTATMAGMKWRGRSVNWGAIGGLAAIAGVVVALVAWWLPRSPAGGGSEPSTSSSTRSSVRTTQSLDGPSPGKTAAATSPNALPASVIRHDGEVLLAKEGEAIDLNAPATDATWGVGGSTGGADTVWYNYALGDYLDFDGVKVARTQTDATYEVCRGATNYAWPSSGSGQFSIEELVDRPRLCLRLTSGRYGAVSKVNQTSDSIRIRLTVWELPSR